MSEPLQAFYVRDGEQLVPTGIGASVWDPTKQGGAPVLGLAAHLLDATPAPAPMLPARLTFDLLGAVPIAPMTPKIAVLRDGKRLQLTAIELEVGGRVYVRGTMLRVRTDGPGDQIEPLVRPFPEGTEQLRRTVADSIRLEGDDETPGPGALWMRIIRPFVADEPDRMLARVAAGADWSSTVAPPADPKRWTYASVDLSIHLSRIPTSEWILLDGRSETAGNGAGYAQSRMGDIAGMFGTVSQTVFLNKRNN